VPPLAHIVQGATLPTALGWVAAVLIASGGLAIFLGRGGAMEVVGWVVLGVAFVGAASIIAVTAILPTSARISISLAAPHSGAVSSPMQVVVCARDASSGVAASAPDGDNVLAVVVDGRELAVEHTGRFAVEIAPGRHALRVEMLTRDHVEFNPPVIADATITVDGTAPLGVAPGC
jgi:hypothetical protein